MLYVSHPLVGARRGKGSVNGIRKGMWIVVEDRVGIANKVSTDAIEFHIVRDDGSTLLIVDQPTGKARQARLDEIPNKRRPMTNQAQRFGYK